MEHEIGEGSNARYPVMSALTAKPLVDEIYAWRRWQCTRTDLLPSEPFTLALKYLGDREQQLRVFLADPSVPLDTNHVERGLRRIPMGCVFR